MTAVIYARYSSDNQREESIEGQIRECTAYAEKNGITILLICKGKEAGLLQMWQTSHYDDYCWDLMVSTIAISCKRFAGLRTARKEVNNTIPIINASGKIGILHAVPQKFVMRLAKTTQCTGSPMIQPKIIPLTAYVIASATIIFMSC